MITQVKGRRGVRRTGTRDQGEGVAPASRGHEPPDPDPPQPSYQGEPLHLLPGALAALPVSLRRTQASEYSEDANGGQPDIYVRKM